MRLVAVVGPSGAGKDLLMSKACAAAPSIRIARRVITRPSSAGGEDFEGVTPEDFARRRAAGDFALDWEAHGLRYAIPHTSVQGDGTVLCNLSRGVLAAAKAAYPELTVIVVTAPPEILAARLAGRGREEAEDRAARLARADFPLPEGIAARIVMNDGSMEAGLARFLAALQPESA